jgi:hypothetical protein
MAADVAGLAAGPSVCSHRLFPPPSLFPVTVLPAAATLPAAGGRRSNLVYGDTAS